MFDLWQELAAVQRDVAIDSGSELVSVTVARTYPARVEDAWSALTDPERIPRWFYPITGDLRPGGSFQLEGNAGGDIRACERPHRLEVTFGGPESIVEVRVSDESGGVRVELTHTVPLAMAQSGAGALFVGPGWDGAMLGLGIFLRGDAVGDPQEAANSREVIEFNKGSIEAWVRAVEESGTASADEIAAGRAVAEAQYTQLPAPAGEGDR